MAGKLTDSNLTIQFRRIEMAELKVGQAFMNLKNLCKFRKQAN